ncbi:MAG: peptidoglycan-binding domain-containing protein [Candidatus Moraniibacteriota bacterium]
MALALTYLFSKIGNITSATRFKASEAVRAAQAAGHAVVFLWGYDANASNPEHHSGRAVDFMVGNSRTSASSKAAGDFIYAWLWRNRARLRVRHIIWRQSVTSTVREPGKRRPMANRGNDTANHYDHVHVWFLDDGYAPATAPKPVPKPVPKPKPTTKRVLKRGSSGNDVRRLQAGLKEKFGRYAGHLVVDGEFGPKTEAAVKEFQRRVGIKDDGQVGDVTRARLARYKIIV